MIVDERIYTLKVGALKAYRDLYVAEGKDIQTRILGDLLGYYFVDVGTQSQVVHLWAYDSFDDREQRRAALFGDPDWLAYIAKVTPLVEKQENRIMKPLF